MGNLITKSEVHVTARTLMDLYVWLAHNLDVPQNDAVVSLAIAMNEMCLHKFFTETDKKLWRKEDDPQWEDWRRAEIGLIDKYADRDNMGRVIKREDGSPSIEENAIEYNKECQALIGGEFKEFSERMGKGEKANDEILNRPVRIKICCINSWEHCPKNITPRLLSILMGNTVEAIMTSA